MASEQKKKLPKSIRKHIRNKKAMIRRGVPDAKEREKLISELYKKFSGRLMNP
jgi:hypothetical protein